MALKLVSTKLKITPEIEARINKRLQVIEANAENVNGYYVLTEADKKQITVFCNGASWLRSVGFAPTMYCTASKTTQHYQSPRFDRHKTLLLRKER